MLELIKVTIVITLLKLKSITRKDNDTLTDQKLIICDAGIGDVIILTKILKHKGHGSYDLFTNEVCKKWLHQTKTDIYENIYTDLGDSRLENKLYSSMHSVRSNYNTLLGMLVKNISFKKVFANRHYDSLNLKRRLSNFLSTKAKKDYYSSFHITELYSEVLNLNIIEESEVQNPKSDIIKKVGIHGGASNFVRCLDPQALIELIEGFPEIHFYLFGSKAEQYLYPPVRFENKNVTYLIGKLEFDEIQKVMSGLDVMICSDSMFLHFSDYIGIPSIAVMGPGPVAMWQPKSKVSMVLTRNPACSPCTRKTCNVYNGKSCVADVGGKELVDALLLMQKDRQKFC